LNEIGRREREEDNQTHDVVLQRHLTHVGANFDNSVGRECFVLGEELNSNFFSLRERYVLKLNNSD